MKKVTIVLILLFIPLILFADDDTDPANDDFGEMGLELLLDMKIVTATQKEQTAAEAPAIISVLTSEQIEQLGITTLYEALDFLPGVLVTESFFGYTMVNIRGILQTHYNNKVLLMVNGHPMREVVNGSFHLEIIPIQAIDRIEVIRGPGSALYGTNAFAGVINIITKKGNKEKETSVDLGGGSFNTLEAAVTFSNTTVDLDYFLALSTRNDSGYSFNIEEDEEGLSKTLDYENDVTNFWASFTYNDFTFSGAYFDQKKEKFGITPVIAYSGPNYYSGSFLDLVWQKKLNEEINLKARLRYDDMDREFKIGEFPYSGFQGYDNADTKMITNGQLFGSEFHVDYNPNSTLSILTGVVYELSHSDPYLFKFEEDNSIHPFSAYYHSKNANDLSIYSQGLLFFKEKSHIVLGFRYNTNSDSGTSVVPQAGLVYNIAQDTFIKALYAEAYRSPDFFEKNVETYNVLYGNSDLDPEKVRSFDVAIDTTIKHKVNLILNAFYLTTDDLVTRVPTSDPETTGENAAEYVNLGGQNIWGVEASVFAPVGKKAHLFANYSYRKGENSETELEGLDDELEKDLIFIAEHTFNAGLSWKAASWFNVNPSFQYVSKRGDVDPYFLANLVLTVPVNDYFSISLIGKNITDEDYSYPEYVRNNINEIPGGPEQSFFIRAKMIF